MASTRPKSDEQPRPLPDEQRTRIERLIADCARLAVGFILVGTVVAMQFVREGKITAFDSSVQTLAIAVVAFYFGSRSMRRRSDNGKEPE